jgi:hypothetical protein
MSRARLLIPLLALTACDAPLAPSPGCTQTGPVSTVDGGLSCGEDFGFTGPDGAVRPLALRAIIAVSVDLAGAIHTEAEATVHVLLDPAAALSSGGPLAARICDVQFPRIPVPGQAEAARMVLVPGAYAALAPTPVDVVALDRQTCGTFATGWGTFVMGARLSGPEARLPDVASPACTAEAATQCLLDLEPDGCPGATLLTEHFPALDVEAAYVAIRTEVQLTGTLLTPDRLVGQVGFAMAMSLVGCRLAPAGGGAVRECTGSEAGVIAALNPRIEQLPAPESRFVAVAVPAGTTCGEVVERSTDLFGR